jgi:hypothetical protein
MTLNREPAMPSNPPAPVADRSSDWRQRLREASLPALADQATWQRLLADAEDPDATQQRIAFDLPVALSFLVEASRSPRIAGNLTGLQHALRMFGTQRVQQRLKQWTAGCLDPAQPAHRAALQALGSSRLACLFLSRWMRHSLVPEAEYRLWVTALLGVARWKLPLVDERLALAIEQRVAQGQRRQRVERALLGMTLDTLNVQHLQDLGFTDAPDLASRIQLTARHIGEAASCARDEALPATASTTLARRLRDPLVCSGLAYALALETQFDWHSPRCTLLIRAAATALNRPISGVLADLHRAAVEASDEAPYMRELLAPAARLIRLPRPRFAMDASSTPEAAALPRPPATTEQVPQAPAEPVRVPSVAASFLARCRSQGFDGVASFLRASVDTLAAVGLPRCALFLRMKHPERVANYLSQGLGDPAAVRRISFPPNQPGLTSRLLSDPHGAYWIPPKQVLAVRAKLPQALSGWPPAGGFALATVQVNEAPMGFWWADAGDRSEALDARQYAALKALSHVFGAEFTRLIKLQRAGADSAAAARSAG